MFFVLYHELAINIVPIIYYKIMPDQEKIKKIRKSVYLICRKGICVV